MNRLLEYHINNGNNNEDYVFYNCKLLTKSKLEKKNCSEYLLKRKEQEVTCYKLKYKYNVHRGKYFVYFF